jgi:type III secretion system-like peptide-binding chaperone
VEARQIEVNAIAVRRALARSFTGVDAGDHAWRGGVGTGDATVDVDVRTTSDGRPYVEVGADVMAVGDVDDRLARVLLIENSELVLGRFTPDRSRVRVEHSILAGTTMAAVEVQATVWTIGWAASAFRPRLEAMLRDATPVPPAPRTPAALRRDAADHVSITDRRVKRFLDEHYGGFEHDPSWGYHGGFGSTRVFIDVLPVLEESTAVRLSSPVLSDVDLSPDLALELLRLTAEQPFGRYSYAPARREVWFEHAILGDDLDQIELESAIDVVAATADGHDDALAAQFGGLRYADL